MCDSNECIKILKENMPYIRKEYEVTGLCLFGSMARGDNKSDSDVDILVDMPPKITLMTDLKDFLENILNTFPSGCRLRFLCPTVDIDLF